ncbi:MAG: non-ribosomal peptide synthase/polyketide synthase [Nitrosomonas ureae]
MKNNNDLAQRRARLTPEQQQRLKQRLQANSNRTHQTLNVSRRQAGETAHVSYAQQRHWFLWQLDPQSTAYHLGGVLRLIGKLDIEALQASFRTLITRHESLRTVFRANAEGLPEQIIEPEGKFELTMISLCDLPAEQRAHRAREETIRVNAIPFDLTQGSLLRVALIRVSAEEHHLVVVMHHIISDAWSNRIIIDEFAACYRAHIEGPSLLLPELPIQYADYAQWQRNWLEAGEKERQLVYWRNQLGVEHPALQLPTDHPRSPTGHYQAATFDFTLPEELVARLQRQAQDYGATLYMMLLTGFQALLYRITGQNDIRVGVPIANRHRIDIESVVGLFVNTQVMRNCIDGRTPLGKVIEQVREAALSAQAYQDLPFEQLVEALQPERNLHQNPLFQVMFNHMREDYHALQQLPELTVEEYELGERGAQFELTLDTIERPDQQVDVRLTYAAELFETSTIKRYSECYLRLLEHLAEHPERCLGDITLLSAAEWDQLKAWGINERCYGANTGEPVHRLFERQVTLRPEATALIFGNSELNYLQLNERANRLAHQLIVLGVKPGSRVGIAIERSIEMVAGLLATLKAGGTYVPLDPEYSRERLMHMVTDSQVMLLLTQSHIRERVPEIEGNGVLELDTLDLTDCPSYDPEVKLHGEHLAYIIYTSGSTGMPKGVGVSHFALAQHVQAAADSFNLCAIDRVLLFSTINFDAFIDQLFPALCVGASAVLRDSLLWDSETFYQQLIARQITVADLTTSYWQLLISDFAKQGARHYGSLRQINVGGERMSPEALNAWNAARLDSVALFNAYGPTEAVVTATLADCSTPALSRQVIRSENVAIGKPLAGRHIYLLDADLMPVMPGISGELCIGGGLLARGYLNKAGLTAERFIANPFDAKGGRLYRTGDLARWRADGQIEYLGRVDDQVKVRGFRIELGEVEAQLQLQPDVREAVVVAREGPGGMRLVAYVSLHAGYAGDAAALRESLGNTLPDYMIPSAIIVLESLPLNANGKVDRKRLPEPEFLSTDRYEAPQGEIEEALAGIWQEILGIGRIGRNDNFFELGGDSILSLQIVTKVRRAGWKITPRQLFERQTIAALAILAKPVETIAGGIHEQAVSAGEPVPMLPIQLEFFEQKIPSRHHWNQAMPLRIRQSLNALLLEQALKAMVQHHRALRSCYEEQADGRWTQIPTESISQDLLWKRHATNAEQLTALCNEAQRSLNLQQGPLIRGMLVDMADHTQRLLLVIHHLVIDGVSWRILMEDLETAYTQALRGETTLLPENTSDYSIWTQRLQQYAHNHATEFAHWQNLANTSADLPCDFPQGSKRMQCYQKITVNLNQEQTQALLKDAPAAYRTQVNDLLLSALGNALCHWSGHKEILVDLEGHGREDLYPEIDLSRTIGWFTSIFPVVLSSSGDLARRIKQTKEYLRRIPNKGLGYGLFKYYGTEEQRQILAGLPKAQVVFNYLGQFDANFAEDTLWTLAGESVGESMDAEVLQQHDLLVNSHIYGGEFCLEVSYSAARYLKATIEAFVNAFMVELEGVIAHCGGDVRGVTSSDFPLIQMTQDELDGLPIPVAQLDDLYPLSPMQTGMLFHSVFDADEDVYLNQLRVDVERLDVERFKAAWQAAIDRHEILRTGFVQEGKTPLQWVARTAGLPCVVHDWRDLNTHPQATWQQDLDALAQSEHAVGIDLKKPPLMRLILVRLTDSRYHFIWVFHHLLLDGWSTSQLIGEILRQYNGETLPSPRARYRDFIEWLNDRDQKESEAYWRERLYGVNDSTRLVNAASNPAALKHEVYVSELEPSFADSLVRFSKSEHITVNTLVQAAWALLLGHYTGRRTITFGVTVAGRPSDLLAADQILGLFINTLPVSVELRPELTVGKWLRDLQAQNLASREHEHTPLYDIQRWAGQSGRGLFDSILVFENYPVDDALKQSASNGLVFSNVKNLEMTNYPMAVSVLQSDTLRLYYGYASQYFTAAMMEHIALRFKQLLREISKNANQSTCLGNINYLSESERKQLKTWGGNTWRSESTEPVHRLFERQANARPNAPALIFGDSELSYAELNRRANQLAHRLIALGIKPESRVGIAVERSVEMIVGLLAALKTGAAYVPLDPDYPQGRLDYMATDSAIELLLTQSFIRERVPQFNGCQLLELDGLDLTGWPENNPEVKLHHEHLAYIIYTSGSTGIPKGVGVAHGPLSMHVRAIGELYGMTPDDRELQFASINFDGAHERWLAPLIFGAALMPRNNELWSADRTVAEILKHRITIACFTPGYLQQLAEFTGEAGQSLPIRSYTVGGEAMSRTSFNFIQETLRPPRIINGYGPTETVITPLIFKAYPETQFDSSYMPIGSLVGDRTAYILDAEFNPVPQQIIGELYLGGTGLARGYLNKAGLTAERFIANPFDAKGGRLYRTGDLARWRADGQIEYLGRVDDQVKVRGFRIELGEVEAQLQLQPDVREAVVVAREGPGGMRLVAYVSLHAGYAGDAAALRESLGNTLPDYMIPSAIIVLESLPLNANGKVDRKRLPEPEFLSTDRYEAPQGEIEEALAGIWQEILGIGRIGRNDNFFELGGDSILSLQIVTKVRRAGWKITPRQLFERQTIAALAILAKPVETIAGGIHEQAVSAGEPVPMLPIQLEFFEQKIPSRHHWNQAMPLRIRQSLNALLLEQALKAMVQHHRALRSCYEEQADGRWTQIPTESISQDLLWKRHATNAEQLTALCNEAQRSLNLQQGPLIRGMLVDMADHTQRLLLVIHHLVIDGVSWRILMEDLETAYTQALRGETTLLPENTSDYSIWTQRLQQYAHNHATEFAHWQNLANTSADLPCDFPQGSKRMQCYQKITVNLNQEQTQALLKDAPAAYRTQVNDLLLSALGNALCHWSGHKEILVDLEGHGREDLYPEIDLSRTIGWFTSIFPVVLSSSGDLARRIKQTKEYLRRIPNKGLGYGLFKYYGTEEQRQILAGLPKAQVVFNYLGQFDANFAEDTLWTLAGESVGESMDAEVLQQHDLLVNSHIYGGEFCLEVSYSAARYLKATIEAFVNAFMVELEGVIAHCGGDVRGVTSSDFPLIQMTQDELDGLPIPVAQLDDLYPLSPMQTGMLFHSVFDADEDVYLNQLRVDVERLDVERFKAAWQAAIDRHEILRTGFVQEGKTPLQWVARTAGLPCVVHDWRDLNTHPQATWQQDLDALAQSEHAVGIDLKKPPLMRLILVRLTDSRYHFIWVFHHLLLDGWSTSQLIGEILRQYNGETLPSPRARYRDFIEWLNDRDQKESEAYWRERLYGVNDSTRLVNAASNPAALKHEVYVSELEPSFADSLVRFSKSEHITVNTLVQAAWALLLGHYTGRRTITFGVTVAGRPSDLLAADQILGLFINTLPVSVELRPELTVGKWLRDLQAQNLVSREHEHTPLYEIQRWAEQSGQGLFDSILVFENYPIDETFKQYTPGGLIFSDVRGLEATNYPMTVSVMESDGLSLHYGYDRQFFSEITVTGIATQIEQLLEKITHSDNKCLHDITLLDEAEWKQLKDWGINDQRYNRNEPVYRLFERQVNKQPDATALIFDDVQLSYAQLNERANRLAHRLIALGVKPESRIGIAVERSIDMVIGLLATLKTGSAYVPLDPDYPQERLNHMIADSAIELLLTQSLLRNRIPHSVECNILELDKLDLIDYPDTNPDVRLHDEHLAYIIYTSGSTGKPKGVGVAHHALAEHTYVAIDFFKLCSTDRMLQFSTINFDGFIEQLFPPLCAGAAIVLRGSQLWDSGTFYRELMDKQITVADLTTAYWFLLVQDFAKLGLRDYGSLRQVHAGGEAMSPEGIKAWRQAGMTGITLLNTYGPTEAVVTATVADCGVDNFDSTQVTIGKPLPARRIYLLDANLAPVICGVAGELCIGGELLARGYLNRSALTAERFVADPFDSKGGRLYRTGDLARWRADGQIEYLGRLDHQVKIRGFRIELGEVETQLLLQSGIREAIVVVKEGSNGAKLAAYVSPHAGITIDTAELKETLMQSLPDYMIPAVFVVLESLPLNANGKIDRNLLPEPEFVGTSQYEAPQGEVEEALTAIWIEVLGIRQIGRNDNFFELGGDSILSLQIVTQARRIGWKFSPRQLFEQQTIAALAQVTEAVSEPMVHESQSDRGYLKDYLDEKIIAALPFGNNEIEDIYPLSPIQEGMLFHTLEAPGTGLYVTQASVEVEGLDAARLVQAWQAMIARHPILRTAFLWRAGLARPLQIVLKQAAMLVHHLDWREKELKEEQITAYADQELKREFDFLNPPLARLSLIRIDENRHQLIWTKHHILLDGWSDSILISDWLRCYNGEKLAPVGPDYGTYVHWLEKQDKQASQYFWQAELSGIEGSTFLSKSVAKTVNKEDRPEFAQIYTRLSVEETRSLQIFAQQMHITLNTFVQAAWALLLQRYTGKRTVVFGATVSGRPLGLAKADEIVGLFINTIPIPVERHSNLTVSEYLNVLQKTNARLRDYEHTSLADIQRWAGFSGQPLFDSIIVFENYPINAALRDTEPYGLRFGAMQGKGLTGYTMDLQVIVEDTLEIEYSYACNDLTDQFVLVLRNHMELLMREMMSDPLRIVGELGWLGKHELDRLFLLRGNSDSRHVSQVYQPVHRLIERNAVLQPDAIALLMGEQEISYAGLNMRANKLAHRLIQLGIEPEMRVGVAMERSLDIIVTLLAILKSGAAYVPLDLDYPADRFAFMIKDSALSLLITQSNVLPKFRFDAAVPKLAMDAIELEAESVRNPEIPVHEHNLAYVIYTSGSTGLPKGVAVTHGPLAMHCQATARIYDMHPSSCELLFMSFSFDGVHERWLTALTVGAGLAVRDQELWTAEQTYDALRHYSITNAAFPPAYLGQIAEWAMPRNDPPPVELYVFGGEAMPKTSYDLIRRTLRPRTLINGYGPTETVVTPLIWKTQASSSFNCAYAPIGRPVGERVVYVLDVDLQLVPAGIVGELYIGGYGLARGYLEQSGLTAERFIADPFDESGGRLYRTGDLVRWMDDGNIEYVGRADHQVKIRGFRIELGEIEARIREINGVTDAAVVVRQSATGAQLTAYVVSATEQSEQSLITHLKQTLGQQLPEYMLPAHFVSLNALPRLPSGKLDRKALPEPEVFASDTYQKPSTPEAKMLASIWQEVLGVERVGETDNFFAVGGDSLSSLKVMARIRGQTDGKLDFKLRDLIQRTTIASLLGLDKRAPADASGLLALNQSSGDKRVKPLFCIHAGLGTVFDYQPLARQLQGIRAVYGLPCRMLADISHRDVSLTQMAEDYCRMIQAVQPEGPYHLLGWSLGGTLAALMAAMLETNNQIIAFLGLIDPYVPGVELPQSDDWRQDFFDFVSVAIPGAEPDDDLRDVLASQSMVVESKQAVIDLLEKVLSIRQTRIQTGKHTEIQDYADLGVEELAHVFLVARHLKILSLQTGALNPLHAEATCWWAETRDVDDRHTLEWQLKPTRIRSMEINTDHFNIVRAEALLSKVKLLLRAVSSDCGGDVQPSASIEGEL